MPAEPWLRAEAIETDRLRLTPLRAEDADEMFPVLNDQRLHEFTDGDVMSREEMRTWFAFLARGLAPDGQEIWLNWLVRLRDGGQPIGYVQAGIEYLNADVAWVIGVPWQRQGYGSEAATAMVDWLIAHRIALLVASIHPDHAASAAIARRCGLAPTDEVVQGEVIWRRILVPSVGRPPREAE
jgi:RimJ/RimL family protein N-acetyltransferase